LIPFIPFFFRIFKPRLKDTKVCKLAMKEPEKYPEKEANRYSNQISAPGVQG